MQKLSRRAFLRNGTLLLAGVGVDWSQATDVFADESRPALCIGMVTDLHYADKAAAGTRHYRETLTKLSKAVAQFRQDQLDFVVELGDFVDAAESVEIELEYLKRVEREFAPCCENRHYVLGNHCVDTLTKEEFLAGVGKEQSFYSFDTGDHHFVVLDACFRSDGQPYGRKNSTWTDANIPGEQLTWLRSDLKKVNHKAIVFAHQRLDETKNHSVKNAAEVRRILEESGKVKAVFQATVIKTTCRTSAASTTARWRP
jgi:alkaline phosphatase